MAVKITSHYYVVRAEPGIRLMVDRTQRVKSFRKALRIARRRIPDFARVTVWKVDLEKGTRALMAALYPEEQWWARHSDQIVEPLSPGDRG